MVREHAVLPVVPGQEAEFEADLAEGDRLEAHTEGFRRSPAYPRWRGLLHHFYDPFPDVQHFEDVVTA
jgi:hypothetical protein